VGESIEVGRLRGAGKEATRVPRPSIRDGEEGPDLTPPGAGFELYRHRRADEMKTSGWHGYYWARRTAEGDYEVRTVPSSLGEPSAHGGTFPKKGFEELYEKVVDR
jgi:hypothetical protein